VVKSWIIYGSLFSLLAIVLGAFGAHGLKNVLDDYGKEIYNKAVFYHFIHAISILIVAILQNQFDNINLSLSVYLFISGIIIFSGSLYLLSITNIRWLGSITPLGGFSFIIGWFYMIYTFYNYK
jgi:uncharacterized membrane protein YgdD (TMEM256/DUF423 family)